MTRGFGLCQDANIQVPVSKHQEEYIMLKEGDKAPDFTTVDHTGKETRLADLRGQKVWLWFFSSPGGGN